MEITVTTEQARIPVTVMRISGNIDSVTHEQFHAKARELIQGGVRYLLIDLTDSPFVSSAGLRALHNIFKTLRTLSPESQPADQHNLNHLMAGGYKSPHLKLLNLSPETKTAFELSGFQLFIETFADEQTAIASF